MLDPQTLSTIIIGFILAFGTLASRYSDSNKKARSELKKTRAQNLELEGHIYTLQREIVKLGGTVPPLPPALEAGDS